MTQATQVDSNILRNERSVITQRYNTSVPAGFELKIGKKIFGISMNFLGCKSETIYYVGKSLSTDTKNVKTWVDLQKLRYI